MKKIKYFILILFTCIFSFSCNAQFNNNTEAAFYDMGLGAFVGGIGAIINKKPNEKTGKVLLKGLWQGALGGYFVFESKRLIRLTVNENSYNYFWPSKIVNSVGTSILENATANKNFWENYHINFGFNRFEFDMLNKGKFSYKIMPFALYITFENLTLGKFDFDKSMKTGTFIFKSKNSLPIYETSFGVANSEAYTKTNQIIYDLNKYKLFNIAHEMIHVYQYEQLSNFNALFIKPKEFLNKKSKLINFYNKHFYTDFNQVIGHFSYISNKNYQTNFFENEARFYTE